MEESSQNENKLKKFEHSLENNQLVSNDYLNKNLKSESCSDIYNTQALSPIIELAAKPNIEVNPSFDTVTTTSEKPQNDQTSVTLKISKKACKNIQNTIIKLSDLMLIPCPTQWDLGHMIRMNSNKCASSLVHKTEPLQSVQELSNNSNSLIKMETNFNLNKISSETALTVQNLINSLNFKTCKFCESYLVNGKLSAVL